MPKAHSAVQTGLFDGNSRESAESGAARVSVLVRTMGRASLTGAIESVQEQDFDDWELLVLNASGSPLAERPEVLARSQRIRLIEPDRALDRAAAANALLDAARGEYALFLDDDDWLLASHLAKLAGALDSAPSLVAAYGDVECIANAGTSEAKTVHVFKQDFDRAALQLQNFLPIHSVMFRVQQARQAPACRFDEGLKLFEDWDFWLQLAAKGPFRRVEGVSAVYALSAAEGSGHTEGQSAQRRLMLRQVAERQLARWGAEDVAAMVDRDIALSGQLNQYGQEAALARAHASQLEQQVSALTGAVDSLTQQVLDNQRELRLQQAEINKLGRVREQHLQQLQDIYNSRSWKLTRPLRGARRYAQAIRRRLPLRLLPNAAKAVRGEISRHGLMGFARRLPYYLRHSRTYLAVLRSRPPAADAGLFAEAPPSLRDIRLHPDLEEKPELIDAKVSVVIPTLNAGLEFSWMLRKLRTQRGVREIEIVVVDSGSRDQTVAYSREAGAKVVEILPSEFSHSYARNLGADNASGDYVLFMVQDAYPIGDYWMHGMLRFLLDHGDEKLAAVSCAEFSRSDSDMMYDSMINTHYRFLGCLEYDRIGQWKGDDHMALRSQGQLSDVSCLIARERFQQYRYQGNYAEDLDLGIRLIKDGMRVAMLASVKVIHSHNRPAYYYLKRSFVDVVFLVGLFDDFAYPRCESLAGLLAGVRATAAHIARWLEERDADPPLEQSLGESLEAWIQSARRELAGLREAQVRQLGDDRLEAFVISAGEKYLGASQGPMNGAAHDEARRFVDSFLARLAHFNQFASQVYGPQDSLLQKELADVVRKTFASAVGSALAFYCLGQKEARSPDKKIAEAIHQELAAGV